MYRDILCCLRDTIHWKHLELWQAGNWVLHHNSLPTHWSDLIYEYLSKHDVTVLSQPPYSPDLAQTSYYLYQLYQRLKEILSGRQFATSDDKVATSAASNSHKEWPAGLLLTTLLLLAKVHNGRREVLQMWCITELPITWSIDIIALLGNYLLCLYIKYV